MAVSDGLFVDMKKISASLESELSKDGSQFRESFRGLFEQYLQYLKENKKFFGMPSFERESYKVYREHRENEPDEFLCSEQGEVLARVIPIYEKGVFSFGATRHCQELRYPEGMFQELYLLEDGLLLGCELNNQINETMSPTSHTTTKIHTLTREEVKRYHSVDDLLQDLDVVQLRDLVKDILRYNSI